MFFKNKDNYKDYERYSKGSLFKVKCADDLVPQGLSYISPYTLISFYTTSGNHSRILIFDDDGSLIREVVLSNKSHVGGIGYDKVHHLIWLCDARGFVSCYPYQEFIKGKLDHKKTFLVADDSLGGGILQEDGHFVCSYLTCFDNKLYVGSFNKKSDGLVKVFDIIRGGDGISLKYLYEFIVPSKIQGITFYKKNDVIYMLLSLSYTRVLDSRILIYKYDYDVYNYSKSPFSFSLPPMLEQICLDSNGDTLLLFESFASKYNYNAKVVVDDIVILDTSSMIDDFCQNI